MGQRTIFERLSDHLQSLKDRVQQLQEQVFQSPPKDMSEFMYRRGQWEECCQEVKELEVALRGSEDDEDEPS